MSICMIVHGFDDNGLHFVNLNNSILFLTPALNKVPAQLNEISIKKKKQRSETIKRVSG